MKIKTSYTNEPLWIESNIHSKMPQELKGLEEIAYNLWWVWNYEATELFSAIDKELWSKTEGNPVLFLQQLSQNRLLAITKDETLMNAIRRVYAKFKAYMQEPVRTDLPSVAYFSMEYGLTHVLKIYSGGLGVLAGDYIKEASDIRADLTAVGFLYREIGRASCRERVFQPV
jgi:starch phosphorylase